MKKLVVVGLLVVLLAFFNPSKEQFKTYIEERIATVVEDKVGGGALGNLLQGLAGSRLSTLAEQSVEQSNYILFSTFELEVPDEIDAKDWRFLGIAGQFIPLEVPEFVEKLKQ